MSFGMGLTVTYAQGNQPIDKADVVVDGYVLFQLGDIGEVSAQERAQVANDAIQQALEDKPTEPDIKIELAESDDIPSIRIDERHMLSVTKNDIIFGVSKDEQAKNWATILKNRLQKAQFQRTPGYRNNVIWQALLAIAVTSAVHLLVRWQRKKLWYKWSHQTQLTTLKRLAQPLFLCAEVLVWFGLALFICERFPKARQQRYELFRFLGETFTRDLFTLGEQSYSLINVFELLLWALLLWIAIRSFIRFFKEQFLKAAIQDRGLQDAIATLLELCFLVLAFFILLQAWGIDLSALTVLASFLGVGLGFGLQNIVNNFFSGWILLLERPVQVGDFINIGDLMGTVERIGSRSTEIRTPDRISIIVPNSELVVSRVMNWSHRKTVSRLHLPLGIAYNSPIKVFHQSVIEAVLTHPQVLRYPKPQVRFLAFGESSLDFDVMVWIRDPKQQFDIKSDLYYLLEANLRRYQIELPFPQREVNVHVPQLPLMMKDMGPTEDFSEVEVAEQLSISDVIPDCDLLGEVKRYSGILSNLSGTSDSDIDQLIEQMRGAKGLEISDRRFRTTVYPNCFVGQEAVSWIVQTQKATPDEAVRLGQALVEKGIIHHVTDDHAFKDEYLFYRFYADEE